MGKSGRQLPMFSQEQTGDLRPLIHVLYDAAETAVGCFTSQWATPEDKAAAIKELKTAIYITRAVQDSWKGESRTKPLADMMRTWLREHTRLLRQVGPSTEQVLDTSQPKVPPRPEPDTI